MDRPATVTRAAALWFVAVAAGVIETALAVTELATEGRLDGGTWVNLGLRILVYAGAGLLVANLARGRRWARWGLAGLLSAIGLAAMIVPSVLIMVEGAPFLRAFGTDGFLALPFVVVRAAHVATVVAATALMFTPSANRYFGGSRGPRALDEAARPAPLP